MNPANSLKESTPALPVASSALAVQSFYMTALKNHLKLSAYADRKANVLLGVNAIILGVVLTNLASEILKPNKHFLLLPLGFFILCCLITILFSIAVTRPQNTSGKFNKEDVANGKVNLAFFGNFHSMEYEEYQKAITLSFKNTAEIYEMLTMDLYFQGKVLDKKYKLLKRTFTFFIFGICASVIAFIISYAVHTQLLDTAAG